MSLSFDPLSRDSMKAIETDWYLLEHSLPSLDWARLSGFESGHVEILDMERE